MAVYTMGMFLGIGVMQWLTGAVASVAKHQGVDPFMAVLATIAAALLAGGVSFALLPAPASARKF